MRADVRRYDLVAEPTLEATLALLAEGRHAPLAGGTELMVALSAGRLPFKPLISIGHLRELRFIRVESDRIEIGSGTTFTDIRRHDMIAKDLPLLAQAASWTGSIANQNRGTLGGNLVNASPAADSPPALLCYDAQVNLISASGSRSLPYADFHLGYKRTALLPGELLYCISVPRTFAGYRSYIRKVGTRNAQAISKIALAALALMEGGRIKDLRIGAASLSEIPMRCRTAEKALVGQQITEETISLARKALASEAKPIDDIRSTAAYRAAVAGNLLEEFLHSLR
jgi:CO/xanthine dehydrogenase FAD-binding subunit